MSKFRFETVPPEKVGMKVDALMSLVDFSDNLTPSRPIMSKRALLVYLVPKSYPVA